MDFRGSTALVTGASSGIGVALADRLAARGADLVLVARSTDKLASLASRLRADHGVRVEVIGADLTRPGAADAVRDEVERRGLRVDHLVNNAGFGSAGPFHEISAERTRREIALDVTAVVDLTHAFLPGMVARRTGGVLNIASTAAFQPAPYMAVYAASKAFVLSFSNALWAEHRGTGVRVTAACPGPVRTGFAAALGVPQPEAGQLRTPEQVAATALRGYERGRLLAVPGLGNGLLTVLPRLAPRRLVLAVASRLVGRVLADRHSPDLVTV